MSAGVHFLMDPGDTLLAYEQKGKDEMFGYNRLLALTSSMDHVQQLEFTYREFLSKTLNEVKSSLLTWSNWPSARPSGYKEMAELVKTYLYECVANGKVSCLRLEL